jgi:hypothetical protein
MSVESFTPQKKKGHKFSPMALFVTIRLIEISHGADAASSASAANPRLNQSCRFDPSSL